MHHCSVCQKGFPSASKLQRHYLIHTGQKPFTCLICGKAFRQSVHLKKHSDTHTVNYQNWSNTADSLQHPIPVPTNLYPTHEKSGHCNLITSTQPLPTVSFYKGGSVQRTPPEIYSTCSETKPQPELITLEDNSCFISEQSTLPGRHYFTSLMLQDNTMGSDGMDSSVWPTDDVHTCTVCLMCFSSSHQLQRHLLVHSQTRPFECTTCHKTFRLRAHLKMHSQIHERRSTGSFKTIPMHSSQHSSSRLRMRVNHECPTCSKTFCSPSKLKRHFLTHTGQKPFSCEVCGKKFRQVSHLKTHLYASHHKSNLDSTCTKPKDNPVDTKNNTNVEIQCEISVNAPQNQERLETISPLPVKVEPNTNSNSPFQCSICSKTFISSIRRRQHYMTHKEVRPFECRVCGRAFRLSTHLKRHQISHGKLDTTKCVLQLNVPSDVVSCSKIEHVYPTSEKIRTSPELNESKPLELNIIVKPEHWKPNVNDDEDLPSVTMQNTESTEPSQLKMPGSGESNSRRNTISQKRKNQPLNHHQCVACLKSFPSPSKLQRHMLTHTGQRPYGCHMCGKRFRQPTHLRIHSRTHVWSRNGKSLHAHRSRTPCRVTESEESPMGVEFQKKLPENGDSDRRFKVSCPTERQSGQGRVFSYEHNESNSKRQWIQCSTSSPSKPPHPLQIPPETIISGGNLQLKNLVKPSEGNLHNDPNQITAPRLAVEGGDVIPMGVTRHTKHKCLLCFKGFSCASKLQRHNLVHTGLRPFQCLACGKTFRQATHLKVHERTHIKWNPFRPASRQVIRLKIRRQQQLHYPKVCVQVPVASSTKAEPSISESLIECRPFQDNVEDNFYNRAPSLQDDNINKTYKEPIQTSLSKSYNSSPTSKVTCGKRKAHLCTVCQKSFDTPSKLSRHFLIHTGVRPFKCTLCTKTFRQPCHLRSHEQRAHENRTFSGFQDSSIVPDLECLAPAQGKTVTQSYKNNSGYCPVTDESLGHCSQTGETKFVALQEKPNNDMDSESKHCEDYWCTEYPSNVLSSSEPTAPLAGHRHVGNIETTGETLLQQEMGSQMHSIQLAFQTNQVLADEDSHNVIENEGSDHYWREPVHTAFQCDTCVTCFETEKDLQLHKCVSINQIEVTQSSPYQCAICFKDFKTPSKLQRHYVTHTGERPFQCKACDKTFTQASHLKTHQRTHK